MYIAMPPLFKVIPKKGEGQYLYDEKELEKYRKTHTGDFYLCSGTKVWARWMRPSCGDHPGPGEPCVETGGDRGCQTGVGGHGDADGKRRPPRRQFIYDHADEAEIDA